MKNIYNNNWRQEMHDRYLRSNKRQFTSPAGKKKAQGIAPALLAVASAALTQINNRVEVKSVSKPYSASVLHANSAEPLGKAILPDVDQLMEEVMEEVRAEENDRLLDELVAAIS